MTIVYMKCNFYFPEPESLVRCLAFVGPMLACGDFGGTIHTWELEISPQTDNAKKNPSFKVCKDPKLKYCTYPNFYDCSF